MTAEAFLVRQRIETNDAGTDHLDAVYDAARDDALQWLSKAAPADLSASLAVESGTLSYPKPDRFLTMHTSETVPVYTITGWSEAPKYRIATASGLSLVVDEHFTLFGGSILLTSDPAATETWTVYYGGIYRITDLPDEWVPIVLDYATARVFDLKATAAASFFDYSMGPESVNRDAESGKWLKLRDARLARATAELGKIRVTASSIGTIRLDRA